MKYVTIYLLHFFPFGYLLSTMVLSLMQAENIFLHKSIAKLGDFGVSRVLGESHAYAETMCGTPYYFSPEIIENRPYGKMTGKTLRSFLKMKMGFIHSNSSDLKTSGP